MRACALPPQLSVPSGGKPQTQWARRQLGCGFPPWGACCRINGSGSPGMAECRGPWVPFGSAALQVSSVYGGNLQVRRELLGLRRSFPSYSEETCIFGSSAPTGGPVRFCNSLYMPVDRSANLISQDALTCGFTSISRSPRPDRSAQRQPASAGGHRDEITRSALPAHSSPSHRQRDGGRLIPIGCGADRDQRPQVPRTTATQCGHGSPVESALALMRHQADGWGSTGDAPAALTAAAQGASLVFAHAAPHTGVLAGVQRPFKALRGDGASSADGFRSFGLFDGGAGRPDRKEELWVFVRARGFVAPVHHATARLAAHPWKGRAQGRLRILTSLLCRCRPWA